MFIYKCTYNELHKASTAFGVSRLVEKTKKFDEFLDAVQFSRSIANNANLIGKPIIEEIH